MEVPGDLGETRVVELAEVLGGDRLQIAAQTPGLANQTENDLLVFLPCQLDESELLEILESHRLPGQAPQAKQSADDPGVADVELQCGAESVARGSDDTLLVPALDLWVAQEVVDARHLHHEDALGRGSPAVRLVPALGVLVLSQHAEPAEARELEARLQCAVRVGQSISGDVRSAVREDIVHDAKTLAQHPLGAFCDGRRRR